MPNDYIHVTWQGDDNGHPVYVLAWSDGNEVYCKSGEQCDGTWGYHDYRCKAWYKKYVYQDREKVELYRWVKESDWTDSIDSTAKNYSARFQPVQDAVKPGDVTLDGIVSIKDATEIQFHLASLKKLTPKQLDAADVNKDGVINITDATNIQRYLAGYNIKLG
ncbi:MAG: dockerin type I repeat-containing protein [Ruminococcus sp.]|nr:dockerin type I repeat-containing protein [Ruminococcus sp.]